MNDELIRELIEEGKSLGIPNSAISRIVSLGMKYKMNNPTIFDGDIAEVIRDALSSYDYKPSKEDKTGIDNRKRVDECFYNSLNRLMKEEKNLDNYNDDNYETIRK